MLVYPHLQLVQSHVLPLQLLTVLPSCHPHKYFPDVYEWWHSRNGKSDHRKECSKRHIVEGHTHAIFLPCLEGTSTHGRPLGSSWLGWRPQNLKK